MKKVLIVIGLCLSLFATDFEWAPNLERAKTQAKKEHKLVFLMLSQTTCRICQFMKNKTFEDEKLSNFITLHFVPVKIEIDEEGIPQGFKVIGTPTFYILDASGRKIGRPIVGGAKAPAFLKKLEEYIKR